jgi:hypothetical protein
MYTSFSKTTTPCSSQYTNNITQPLPEPSSVVSSIMVPKQLDQIVKKKKKKQKRIKRCHGDRKLRRLKKKWHKCGKTDEEIKQLIDEYHHVKNENNNQMSQLTTMMTNDEDMAACPSTISDNMMDSTISKSKKRKRISTSASQISMSQSMHTKKIRKNTASSPSLPLNDIIPTNTTTNTTTTTYRKPKYLTMFPNLLFQILRIQLKHDLKKANNRRYIYDRLQLFDRQYRLECHRNLWQSYFILGSEHQLWPVCIRIILV